MLRAVFIMAVTLKFKPGFMFFEYYWKEPIKHMFKPFLVFYV